MKILICEGDIWSITPEELEEFKGNFVLSFTNKCPFYVDRSGTIFPLSGLDYELFDKWQRDQWQEQRDLNKLQPLPPLF